MRDGTMHGMYVCMYVMPVDTKNEKLIGIVGHPRRPNEELLLEE